jgi:hypothetical protein
MPGHETTEPEDPHHVVVILPDQGITLNEILTEVE